MYAELDTSISVCNVTTIASSYFDTEDSGARCTIIITVV